MALQGQDRSDTVFVYVTVTAGGVSLVGDPCAVAFVPTGTRPGVSDWITANIITGNQVEILVGNWQNTTGFTFSRITSYPAQLDMWVDITDSPERPTRPVGTWTVF